MADLSKANGANCATAAPTLPGAGRHHCGDPPVLLRRTDRHSPGAGRGDPHAYAESLPRPNCQPRGGHRHAAGRPDLLAHDHAHAAGLHALDRHPNSNGHARSQQHTHADTRSDRHARSDRHSRADRDAHNRMSLDA